MTIRVEMSFMSESSVFTKGKDMIRYGSVLEVRYGTVL